MVTIRIRNLAKRFGDVVALDHLDLDIAAGELFFLLGPSGSGKTTLLRTVAGFHLPEAGTIHFDDDEVTRLPPYRRETGMMFQSYALWPHLNVFRNVAFGLEERSLAKTEIRRRVAEALAMVKMEGLDTRRINELSGGQQQRVALARALVIRPRCLLLDEPLSNLDSKLRIEMRGEIRRICKEFGLTAIYVTHDQKEALSMADRMTVLEAGKIAQTGTPEDLYRRPQSAFVSSFVGETNLITGKIAFAAGEQYRIRTPIGELTGRTVAPDWRPATDENVILSIRPECLSIHSAPPEENAITGHLTESIYLGETAQYALRCEGRGAPIHISELNPHRVIRDTTTSFHATAKPEDIVILPSA